MRTKLFNLIGSFGENFVEGLRFILELFINTQVHIADLLVKLTANYFRFVLWIIDRERMDHAEQTVLQSSMNTELEILMMVSKVKEDALSIGVWKENHSMALNELGSRLYNECDWEEDQIHRYLRMVVESIPGLIYATSDDEDDEDEGIRLEDR